MVIMFTSEKIRWVFMANNKDEAINTYNELENYEIDSWFVVDLILVSKVYLSTFLQ